MKIVYTKWGLANRFADRIEINEALKEYPELHELVLQHELGHHDSNSFIKDLSHDLKEKFRWDLFKFVITHPRTLINYLPIWYYKEKLVIEKSMSVVWLVGIIWLLLIWTLTSLL